MTIFFIVFAFMILSGPIYHIAHEHGNRSAYTDLFTTATTFHEVVHTKMDYVELRSGRKLSQVQLEQSAMRAEFFTDRIRREVLNDLMWNAIQYATIEESPHLIQVRLFVGVKRRT